MPKHRFARIDALAPQFWAGDPDAREELAAAGYDLVQFMIDWKRFFIRRFGTEEDLIQEGMIGYYEAMRDWDGSGRFAGWAILCVHRQLMQAVRVATRVKHQLLNEAVCLDAAAHEDRDGGKSNDRVSTWRLDDPAGLAVDPLQLLTDQAEGGLLLEAMCEGFSDLERQVFLRCIVARQSYRKAAADLERHEKSIDNALRRIRLRLVKRAGALQGDERLSSGARAILARVAAAGGTRRQVVLKQRKAS